MSTEKKLEPHTDPRDVHWLETGIPGYRVPVTNAVLRLMEVVEQPKHDGRLDEDDDGCVVSFDDDVYLEKKEYGRGVRIAGKFASGHGDDEVKLTPKQALSLLVWLRQNHKELEQLAQEQG